MQFSSGASRRTRAAALLGAASMAVASVAVAVPLASATSTPHTAFKACVVTDTGGINDHSFNASAYKGLLDAKKLNPNISVSYLSSTSSTDYAPNINTFINAHCGIIVTVGFLMDQATADAATAHPNQKFAIVDDVPTTTSKNVLSLTYDTNQGAFLGGYLAAASSKTGKVATFGGINIPPVTIYMDGFVAGVRYFDKINNKHVRVLGWNPTKGRAAGSLAGSGSFANSFTDQTAGQTLASGDFTAGADLVFPVAGSVGLGAIAAAKAAGAGHKIMWVDTDGCVSDAPDCKYFLGSVTKGVEPSVRDAVLSASKNTFKGGIYQGTLKNSGTGTVIDLKTVSTALRTKLASISSLIKAGKLSVDPTKYPAP
jgi:basic membrane protein A